MDTMHNTAENAMNADGTLTGSPRYSCTHRARCGATLLVVRTLSFPFDPTRIFLKRSLIIGSDADPGGNGKGLVLKDSRNVQEPEEEHAQE